ncbi:uncharacterized protein [Ptychodera flava]|uniref:uncharacterized protein n=1 Tax=Ptychodera flava TaxID=63121 RepID=UPI00396AAD26
MFTEDMMNDADVDKELSMINQDLTYIEPSVRSTNIAAYMLAYTSIDETEGTIKGEGNTTPGDGDTVENGDHNSPNNDTPDDSTHPGVSESASNIMSEPFVPIDQPVTSDPVTIADIEEHQEGLLTNRRVSSPSGDSESQTSGDEASTTSGSFSCSEIPSPVHHAITSIAEIEEPVSETEEDVVTVEVVPEKPTSNGVIESDIMEEERVVIGQEDNSDKTRATEVKAPKLKAYQTTRLQHLI